MRTTLELPEETYASSRPRTVGTLLALVVILVLTANAALVGMLRWYRMEASPETEVVAGKWRHLSVTEDPYDILLVGDSSGLIGVDPRIIAERTGLTCYNACGFGDLLAVNESWLIQHLEGLGRLPRYVVSIHVYDIWERNDARLRQQLDLFPAEVLPWKRYHPAMVVPKIGVRQRIHDALPLAFIPKEARMAIRAAVLEGIGQRDVRTDALGLSRLPSPNVEGTLRNVRSHEQRLEEGASRTPSLSAANQSAYDRMLDVLDRNGSRLLAVEAPTADGLAKNPHYLERLEHNQRMLYALARSRAGFRMAPTGREGFAADRMQNADHLADDVHRAEYSHRVAMQLMRAMAEWDAGLGEAGRGTP
jgi:hypothetical protein